MSDQNHDISILSPDQLAALDEQQKEIFLKLNQKDRQFFAKNFSPSSLGKALERKWETMHSNAHLAAFEERLKENLEASNSQEQNPSHLSATDLAIGAGGVAGVIGIGALARKIAPDGKAIWRGVKPRDLVDPLVFEFARQEKTDIRFDSPGSDGVLHANVQLRTSSGLIPALNLVLAPLKDATQVEISKLSSESLLGTVKESGGKLVDLLKDGVIIGHRRSPTGLLDMAGKVIDKGSDILKSVNDLDLEDRAWETIQRAAEPLQKRFDELAAIEREQRLRLEMSWDDYYTCAKCRVEFGAEDTECRVCGSERPAMPEQADPRKA